ALRYTWPLFFGFLFRGGGAAATTTPDSCIVYTDCVDADYPTCVGGFCADCAEATDSTECSDVSSGAAYYCAWSGGNCVALASAPLFPEGFHASLPWLTLFMGALGFFAWLLAPLRYRFPRL
ncbi:hypothetical protein K2X33_15600, partial [bacterium]|nr:hypothetical protein [bacterium]